MFTPVVVANAILDTNRKMGRTTTPLQLVKLVYIAHGFHLALRDKPLIDEAVEAWRYGPVVRSVYREAKKYGRGAITGELPLWFHKGEELPTDPLALVGSVAQSWGSLSGIALSNWTHLPDSPWYRTYDEHEPDKEIPDDLIRDYFKRFVEKNRAKHAAAAQ